MTGDSGRSVDEIVSEIEEAVGDQLKDKSIREIKEEVRQTAQREIAEEEWERGLTCTICGDKFRKRQRRHGFGIVSPAPHIGEKDVIAWVCMTCADTHTVREAGVAADTDSGGKNSDPEDEQ